MAADPRPRGLGTRLASLLPEGGEQASPGLHALIPAEDQPARERPRLRQDESVFVGLEVLQRAFELDVVAMAYQKQAGPVQLHLRVLPGMLGSPADALRISAALEELFRAGAAGPAAVPPGEMPCLLVPTKGHASRGLYALGRRAPRLTLRERMLAEVLCRTLGESLHKGT